MSRIALMGLREGIHEGLDRMSLIVWVKVVLETSTTESNLPAEATSFKLLVVKNSERSEFTK